MTNVEEISVKLKDFIVEKMFVENVKGISFLTLPKLHFLPFCFRRDFPKVLQTINLFRRVFHLDLRFSRNTRRAKMSWNQTPMSPRKPMSPRMQQQSWEGTPTINLYEPNREFYDSSPNMPLASVSGPARKSPSNQTRKINYNKYCLPNPKHQISDPGTYYNNMATTALKSPKSPREQNFEFELSTPPNQTRSPLKCVGANRRYYEDTSTSDSAPATLVSQRKYEFGSISPKFDNSMCNDGMKNCLTFFSPWKKKIEQIHHSCQNLFISPAGVKKFEYFTPTKTPPEMEDPKMTNKDLNLEMVELFGINKNDEGSGNKPSPFMDPIHFATCSPRKNRNMKKRNYNVSPDGVSSLDESTSYMTTTITYDTHTPSGGRRMSITISDGNSSEISEPALIAESLETSSLITQSTNSRTTASPLPSPSPSSGLSLASTATATCKATNMKISTYCT